MVMIRQSDMQRVAERYIRLHGRRAETILDARALAARLHSKLPKTQASQVSRAELVPWSSTAP